MTDLAIPAAVTDEPTCRTCRYFHPEESMDDGYGLCHRYPPRTGKRGLDFQETRHDWDCGEHRPRAHERAQEAATAGERDFLETVESPLPANEFLKRMFREHGTAEQRGRTQPTEAMIEAGAKALAKFRTSSWELLDDDMKTALRIHARACFEAALAVGETK